MTYQYTKEIRSTKFDGRHYWLFEGCKPGMTVPELISQIILNGEAQFDAYLGFPDVQTDIQEGTKTVLELVRSLPDTSFASQGRAA